MYPTDRFLVTMGTTVRNPPGLPPPPWNKPIDAGFAVMHDAEVTSAMSAWAEALDHAFAPAILRGDDTQLWSVHVQSFNGKPVGARVEWHTQHAGKRGLYVGVTLYHAPYAPEEQAEGLDCSHYQGAIGWGAVAASGRSFAFVKASQGTTFVDPMLAANMSGATEAGLLAAPYHFFTPGADPSAQAAQYLNATNAAPGFRPVLDVEQRGTIAITQYVDELTTWIEGVTASRRRPILYTSRAFWELLGMPHVDADLWIAQWGALVPTIPQGFGSWAFWQYASAGRVPGIAGNVDIDRFVGTVDELRAFAAQS